MSRLPQQHADPRKVASREVSMALTKTMIGIRDVIEKKYHLTPSEVTGITCEALALNLTALVTAHSPASKTERRAFSEDVFATVNAFIEKHREPGT